MDAGLRLWLLSQAKQEVTALPTAVEVSGPGDFFETFMDDHDDATKINIPAKDIYAKFGYEAREVFRFRGRHRARYALQDAHRHPQT